MLDSADPVDRLLLEEAADALARAQTVVVIDDETAALTGTVSSGVATVRCYNDSATIDRAVAGSIPAHVTIGDALDADLLRDADVVLLRLPKSLAALDEIAAAVATFGSPTVELFAGGRVKHLTRSMNDTLARHFRSVRASLGRQKSRVLVAAQPAPPPLDQPPTGPRHQHHDDLDVTLCAFGGTFAGTEIDLGSRFLVGLFDQLPDGARTVVDLGSGSGLLAVLAARRLPSARVVAVDDSRAAIRSTAATASANDLANRISTLHTDRLDAVEAVQRRPHRVQPALPPGGRTGQQRGVRDVRRRAAGAASRR